MILINFFASFSIFGMEFCVELCVENFLKIGPVEPKL